ncbi:MAG: fructose-6-phosphate aldolase [Acidobacteriaceae bacterium]|nr:fructose-6-phosphate aldolase [Acidobacteriaceae bacterium]MBV9225616.1 fructose-6-phosphate aldolase [Acidobacteriaceae bacterium]MBV9306001.1 fructose-6-phosphate aldolase [Acidobacteriaceae bacterium]MBV9677703.1 fructose-6-phosphate aldolase [Acidobacteriaceae bacterium]MBV9938123.1 fructose-6-phosphate aldolase [Acidobacteriaceae bacterium]
MKFFLDSANLEDIKKGAALGILNGVTTNPSLIAKEGIALEEQIRKICDIIDGDVSAEVLATNTRGMIEEGRRLARIHKNVVVKVPLTSEGIAAVSALSREGIRTNVTLCFSAVQALIAAKAGAYMVSPFIGRLDDLGYDGMDLIRDIVTIYKNYEYKTQVLAASVRGTLHVVDAAKAGAHIATMPFKVLEQLFKHPLTDKGLEQFLQDYNKAFELAHA